MKIGYSVLAVVLAASLGQAAEPVKSGPQVGEQIPGAFHPLNVTGPNADEKFCLVCKNGGNPVAMIFAREVSEPLVQLMKKIDAATEKNSKKHMGSFVVFCTDKEDLGKELKQLARKEKLYNIILSIDNPAGPDDYNVAKNADITVVLYTDFEVKANHTFKKGELKAENVDKIVADVAKILK
jgi:hypothetical protein